MPTAGLLQRTGNTLWVDAVNGDDSTAASGDPLQQYATITAAIADAVSGDVIEVRPGSYDESSLVIPDDVSLVGVDRLRCIIAHTTLDNTTVVTMGANSSVESLTIEAGTAGGRALISFPGTTSATSLARNCVLNGTAGNVSGISIAGTGTSLQNWVTVDHVDIKGTGVSNGILANGSGFFVARDCICYGLVGFSAASGGMELQDCKITGLIGLNIAAGASVYVNQSTRWNNLTNLGTLASAGLYLEPTAPPLHALTHELGGSDQVDVTGLSGVLADPQVPDLHAPSHESGGGDEINVTGLMGILADPQLPDLHGFSHESGGADEIDVTGLFGVLADPQAPDVHALTHLSTGADPIDTFIGATAVTDGLDGLVIPPLAGEEGFFLRGDGSWSPGSGGGITGPGVTIDRGVVVWDGTGGAAVDDAGVRNYGADVADPALPVPSDGDTYYNSLNSMQMIYDGTRSKWLSTETADLWFGRNNNTGAGAYYRGPGNKQYSSTIGRNAEFNGTIVSITYTRSDADAATFEVTAGGVAIATLASAAVSGQDLTIDADFSQGDILGGRNQSGGNTTSNVHAWARIRWRT